MSDPIDRQAAIDVVCMEWCGVKHQDCKHPFDAKKDDCYWCDGCETALRTLPELPSAQSEITDEQAIEHLQSTGWMQNHDREMYESGLRKQLADDSGSYDSLIPCEDTISRQAAIDVARKCSVKEVTPAYMLINKAEVMTELMMLPSARPEPICVAKVTLTDEQVKEAFEKAKDGILTVLDAQPKQRWIPVTERLPGEDDYRPCYGYEDGAVWWCNDMWMMGLGWYYPSTGKWAYYDESDRCEKYVGNVVAWTHLPEPYREEEKALRDLPSAGPKKGGWLPDNRNYYEERFVCSVCKRSYEVDTCMGEPTWDFCPGCGADMREEEQE